MKIPLLLLSFLGSLVTATATQLGLFPVKMPLYLHGSDSDSVITITEIPFASSNSFDTRCTAINTPFIPPTDGSWKEPADINLASVYGIKIDYEESRPDDITLVKITIDASKAKAPEGYPFSVTQVADAVLTCVKLMMPARPSDEEKLTITVLPPPAAPAAGAVAPPAPKPD